MPDTVQTTHTIQQVFSIESFDASKTTFDRWTKRLESAFGVFNVPVPPRRDYLLHYMDPETYDLLCDKLAPVEPTTKSYDELVAIMRNHFNPESLEIAENFRFLQRRQEEGETAQEYIRLSRGWRYIADSGTTCGRRCGTNSFSACGRKGYRVDYSNADNSRWTELSKSQSGWKSRHEMRHNYTSPTRRA